MLRQEILKNICHQFPLSRNSISHNKKVIVKFVNLKNEEALLKDEKQISGKIHLEPTSHQQSFCNIISLSRDEHVCLNVEVCWNNTH